MKTEDSCKFSYWTIWAKSLGLLTPNFCLLITPKLAGLIWFNLPLLWLFDISPGERWPSLFLQLKKKKRLVGEGKSLGKNSYQIWQLINDPLLKRFNCLPYILFSAFFSSSKYQLNSNNKESDCSWQITLFRRVALSDSPQAKFTILSATILRCRFL